MAAKTPQTPDPPFGARSRPSVPRPPGSAIPVLSPSFSRAPLRSRLAAAADTNAAASSSSVEHPCVTLWDWWLVRVEGEQRKIAVSGFTQRDDAFTSAPIAKCHGPLTLEDEDGVVVLIYGSVSLSRMRENGFSPQICEKFMIGFPYWWESWDSHIESQPTSFSNLQEGSSQFNSEMCQLGKFLEKVEPSFIKNLLNDAKNFPRDYEDAFTECPRFEEYTFDNDISTKEKSGVSNDASEGPAGVANEVDNMEIDLIVSSTSQERGHVDISCNVSFASTEKCTSDETYKEAENQNDTVHPDAREQEAGSRPVNSDLICNRSSYRMPNDLEDGNTNAGNSTDVPLCHLAAVPLGRANCCLEISGALQNIQLLKTGYLNVGYQRNPVASLKNQGHLQRTEDISLNQKAVPSEDTSTSICSRVQTQEKTVGPSKKQRSARDILLSPARLPVTRSPMSSKKQIFAHDKLSSPTILPVTRSPMPSKKQRSAQDKLSSPATLPVTRSPISSVYHSPLTRGRAQSSISISTPESLNMKRTKSGRLVVPPLDPGCERILYDNNHLLLGVAPVELHSPLKVCPLLAGNKAGTPAKKKSAR
ncbi:uncharacterized protein LOC100827224 isoform X1 [Brachypodium distachyon]|uniref:uncharacterized protein LOC100827224 isoform X1 n=1 Tax=Brachypodium distachyon TaxID=15368 RepID=UPI00071D2EB1|nr:uncharacterized protein LOC100827224 isoform X1 [Brachypodium distachyon]|eukprot:XP_014750961.1 uncharacterized protein LOC100827224 isoform X1 [Brachypodium distachyon]